MINKRKKVLAQGKRFSSILMTPPFFFPYKKKEKTSRSNPLNKIKVTLASLQEHHIVATLYSDRLKKSFHKYQEPFFIIFLICKHLPQKLPLKRRWTCFRKMVAEIQFQLFCTPSPPQKKQTDKELPVCCDASTNKTIFDLFSGPDELVSF